MKLIFVTSWIIGLTCSCYGFLNHGIVQRPFERKVIALRRTSPRTCRRTCTIQMARANRFRPAGAESKRQSRVSQLLTQEIATIIRRGDLKRARKLLDEELRAKISVVDVTVSPDLRNARVFISIYGDRMEKREAFAWCVKYGPCIRHSLSQRLKDMKGVPDLVFQQTDIGSAVDVMHLINTVTSGQTSTGNSAIVDGLEFTDEDDEFPFNPWSPDDNININSAAASTPSSMSSRAGVGSSIDDEPGSLDKELGKLMAGDDYNDYDSSEDDEFYDSEDDDTYTDDSSEDEKA